MMSSPPRQILAVGRNYAAHALELGNAPPSQPHLFWKPVGALAREGTCHLPRSTEGSRRIDYEGEVALILGRDIGPGSGELPNDPWDAVAGVAAALDMTDRTAQQDEKDPRWVRAKGFADSCALGPVAPRPIDPAGLTLRTRLNGALVQEGSTDLVLFPFPELIAYLHGFLRLFAGDAILTGTPAGVGPVAPGDEVWVEVGQRGGETLSELRLRCALGPEVAPFGRTLVCDSGAPACSSAELLRPAGSPATVDP